MPVDFPPDPNIGQTSSSSVGVVWTFDGIAWRTGDFDFSIELGNFDQKNIPIASSSGRFENSSLTPNLFCGGGGGWNSTRWSIPFPTDELIPIEYSNVGIPIPVDLPTGSEIRLCGKATNTNGRESFYYGLTIFNCGDRVGQDDIWYYQISPLTFSFTPFQVLQNNTEEGPTYSEACFSLTYTTTSPISKCDNYIVVILGDDSTSDDGGTLFTWTLNATFEQESEQDCCEGPLRLSGAGLTSANGVYYLLDIPINTLFPLLLDVLDQIDFGFNGQSIMVIGLIYTDPFYGHFIIISDNLSIFSATSSYILTQLSPTPDFTPCLWNGNWYTSETEFEPIPQICGNAFSTECQPFFGTYSYSDFEEDMGSFVGYIEVGDVYIFYVNLSESSGFIPSGFVVGSMSYSFGPSGFLTPQLPPAGLNPLGGDPNNPQAIFTVGGDIFEISGSGESNVNDLYIQSGNDNGKPVYSGVSNGIIVTWDGSNWIITDGVDIFYYSSEDVATPNLVITWIEDVGSLPLPEVVYYIYDSGEDIDCILNNPEECAPTYYFYDAEKPNCPPGVIFWVPEEVPEEV